MCQLVDSDSRGRLEWFNGQVTEKRGETAMKELSNETPAPQAPAEIAERAEAPVIGQENRESQSEVFAFDGWGLVPLDLHSH